MLSNVRYRDDGSIQARWDYEYDLSGNLLREKWMSYAANGSDEPTYIDNYQETCYVYDENDNLTSQIVRDYMVGSSGSVKITTSTDNNLQMGEYSERTTNYTYDNTGNLIEEQIYYDGVLNSKHTHQYEENQLRETTNYFTNDQLPSKIYYTYDDNGNCISEEYFDSNDKMSMKSEYTYVYREVSGRHMQRINDEQEFLKSTNI